jgi:predicted transcriptional regulator
MAGVTVRGIFEELEAKPRSVNDLVDELGGAYATIYTLLERRRLIGHVTRDRSGKEHDWTRVKAYVYRITKAGRRWLAWKRKNA